MKVDNQNSVSKVDYLAQSFADAQSIALMRFLNKAAEDICDETLDAKLKNDPEKISSKEGSSSKSASKSKSCDQIFLEAYITSIQMDNKLKLLSQESIRLFLMKCNQEVAESKQLSQEIKELQEKIDSSLTVKEMQDLVAKIEELLNLYNSALAQHTNIQKTSQDCQSVIQELSQKIETLEKKYSSIKDKSSEKAKEVRKELDETILKQEQTQKELKDAKSLLEKSEGSIKDVSMKLSELLTQYPYFADDIKAIKDVIDSYGSVETVFTTFLQDTKSAEAAIQIMSDQILTKKQHLEVISKNLVEDAKLLKGIVDEVSKVDLSNLNEIEAAILLDQILNQYLGDVEKNKENETDKTDQKKARVQNDLDLDNKLNFNKLKFKSGVMG